MRHNLRSRAEARDGQIVAVGKLGLGWVVAQKFNFL